MVFHADDLRRQLEFSGKIESEWTTSSFLRRHGAEEALRH
jgi:hypothetical protein